MTSVGVVRDYDAGAGWGVVDAPDVPGGCWVHFSAIAADGYRRLATGERVTFRAERAAQDGLDFRAVKAWTGDVEPPDDPVDHRRSPAYRSSLRLTFSDE